jgi:hypothetical protein
MRANYPTYVNYNSRAAECSLSIKGSNLVVGNGAYIFWLKKAPCGAEGGENAR